MLAKVEACRERLDRLPDLLKRSRQAVLAAATTGELTKDWREENAKTDSWQSVILSDVTVGFMYGTSAKSAKSGNVPVLRMGNLQDGKLVWNNLAFTSDAQEIEKYRLVAGDVLFNRTNSPELVGKCAVFRGEREAIFAGYLIRVKCSPELHPDFLNYCLCSPAGREYCWRVKSDGVSQSNINARKLAAFPFELPSPEEQEEIVRRVETLFAYADGLEARYTAARDQVERLTPALLSKAFRGELVPQDPNDETASALLERIRAARENKKNKPKTRVSRTTNVMKNLTPESVSDAIRSMPKTRFTFEELQRQLPGDYDTLAKQMGLEATSLPSFLGIRHCPHITESGGIDWAAMDPERMERSSYMYGGAIRNSDGVYDYFSDLLRALVAECRWADLRSIWIAGKLQSILEVNTVFLHTASFRFRHLIGKETTGRGQLRQGYYQKSGIRLEFPFDRWEATSMTSHWHLSSIRRCTVIGIVRSIVRRDSLLIIDSTCLGIGTGFDTSIAAEPNIAFNRRASGDF